MLRRPVILFRRGMVLLIFTLILATRFVGLGWALPYHPHPDEWNMANAITRLDAKDQLNPHFFAYGQFPLYLSYFSASIYNHAPWANSKTIDLSEAIFFLRFYSAIASALTVAVVFQISRKILSQNLTMITTLLATFTAGMIQNAHFGTTEAWLTLCFVELIYLSLKLTDGFNVRLLGLAGLTLGIAVGTKLSGLVFVLPVGVAFVLQVAKLIRERQANKILQVFTGGFLLAVVAISTALITSPHLLVSYNDSQSTLRYETSVAVGTTPVFYTRQFFQTVPIVFQLTKIFPYTNGLPVTLFGLLGLGLALIIIVSDLGQSWQKKYWLVLVVSFVGYLVSQSFLFTKWTRFVAPLFPCLPIFAVLAWSFIFRVIKNRKISQLTLWCCCFIASLPAVYHFCLYLQPDVRFTASRWIYKNIPTESKILYDTGNVIDVPIVPPGYPLNALPVYQTTSFDFYNLDSDQRLLTKLLGDLVETEYVIVPSRRIFYNHERLATLYPLTARYYKILFNGELGFQEIKTFYPLPQLTLGGKQLTKLSDENAEETWSVFDHPVIRIFHKGIRHTTSEYYRLLTQTEVSDKN